MRYFIYFTRVVYVIMNNKRGGRLGLLIFSSSCDGNVKCKLWFSKNGWGGGGVISGFGFTTVWGLHDFLWCFLPALVVLVSLFFKGGNRKRNGKRGQ